MTTANWENLKNLFVRYQRNDQSAVRELYEGLQKKIESALMQKGLHADDVRELTQDILLKIHAGRERYQVDLPLRAWIVTIVERTTIDFWRKNKRTPIHGMDEGMFASDPDRWIESQPESFLRLKELFRHFGILKPLDRTIVDMFALENKSIDEIASELGLTSGAVKVRLHRARKMLKDLNTLWIILFLGSAL